MLVFKEKMILAKNDDSDENVTNILSGRNLEQQQGEILLPVIKQLVFMCLYLHLHLYLYLFLYLQPSSLEEGTHCC